MNKIPNCKEYEYCMLVEFMYKSYYCKHEKLECSYPLGVDYIPMRSPKWCPLRKY